jgi:hypothetical protein
VLGCVQAARREQEAQEKSPSSSALGFLTRRSRITARSCQSITVGLAASPPPSLRRLRRGRVRRGRARSSIGVHTKGQTLPLLHHPVATLHRRAHSGAQNGALPHWSAKRVLLVATGV